MEEILDKVEEEWIAKTIGTLQMQDNAFSNEEYDADDEIDHNK